MNRKISCRSLRVAASLLAPGMMLLAAPSAQGALIGITPSYPDITTSGTDITYSFVAGTGGTLTINGGAASNLANQTIKFSAADSAHAICSTSSGGCNPNTTYSLLADFDASGIFTGGTLDILGYIDGDTETGGVQSMYGTNQLLHANLTAFGFNGSAGTSTYDILKLDFSIAALSGHLFDDYGTGNGLIWVGRVNTGGLATYGGNWDLQTAPMTKSFGCTTSGCAATLDTFVPVPAAVWLFGSGLVGLMGAATRSLKARTES